ncbi:hypothetical protein LZ31DRAFT_581363 [Colletotrichum somersetense]|nr:hypothetical protein LZ31DRAFT_581363 [Colletotrichum somersetense]
MRYLGIDWGSTAVRLYFYFPDEDIFEPLLNLRASSKNDESRYQSGSFGGYINISGEAPVYTGDEVPAALQIPAKLILGKARGIAENNPMLIEINRRQGDAEFERRCQRGLEEIVKAFADQVEKRCNKKNKPLDIVEIGLTIPAYWTLEEEHSYRELIKKVFPKGHWNNRLKDIYFMTEIEAFAQFFFSDPVNVDKYMSDKEDNYVLFLDFGGHSMNGCLFYVRRAEDEYVLMGVKKPFGVVGGSAQWEAAVGDFCTSNALLGGSKVTVKPEVRNGLQKKFREEIRMQECDCFTEIELRIKPPEGYEKGSGEILTAISAFQSARFFNDAMNGPLKRAGFEIGELAKLKGRYEDMGLKVIVSGGTAKNDTVQGKLNGFCDDVHLNPPIFFHQNFGSNE